MERMVFEHKFPRHLLKNKRNESEKKLVAVSRTVNSCARSLNSSARTACIHPSLLQYCQGKQSAGFRSFLDQSAGYILNPSPKTKEPGDYRHRKSCTCTRLFWRLLLQYMDVIRITSVIRVVYTIPTGAEIKAELKPGRGSEGSLGISLGISFFISGARVFGFPREAFFPELFARTATMCPVSSFIAATAVLAPTTAFRIVTSGIFRRSVNLGFNTWPNQESTHRVTG